MSRPLIALLVGLQAVPARFTAEAIQLQASAPRGEGRRAVEIWQDGRQLARGTLLTDGVRVHLALRNELGQPTMIFRCAHGLMSFETVGQPEIVALDASPVLGGSVGLPPEDLVGLLLGRLPRSWQVERAGGGRAGGAWVDRDGRMASARVANLTITHGETDVTLAGEGLDMRLVWGPWERAEIPARAFSIGQGTSPPPISLRRMAQLTQERLLGKR